MELSSPKIKNVLIFFQKKGFLVFRETGLVKKTSYISGGNFPSSKNKKSKYSSEGKSLQSKYSSELSRKLRES